MTSISSLGPAGCLAVARMGMLPHLEPHLNFVRCSWDKICWSAAEMRFASQLLYYARMGMLPHLVPHLNFC